MSEGEGAQEEEVSMGAQVVVVVDEQKTEHKQIDMT